MNSSASKHLAKFPSARASTLADLIERDKVTERLRRELRQMNRFRVKAVGRRVEPLDRPEFADMPEETRTRIRETY